MKHRQPLLLLAILSIALFLMPMAAQAEIIYVKPGVPANEGTSWTDATNLSDALQTASSGDEIWVAAGTYYPEHIAGNGTTERDRSFVIPPGVNVYGGFAGTETDRDSRDWVKNKTILSGDLNGDDDKEIYTDNCYQVVIMVLRTAITGPDPVPAESATLDGFTITGGRANGGNWIIVNSVYFRRDIGGGVYAYGNATLTNNTIYDNTATSNGGGVYANEATLINNTIYGNTAANGGGVTAGGTSILNKNILWENNVGDLGYGQDLYVSYDAIGFYNLIGSEIEGSDPSTFPVEDNLIGDTYDPLFVSLTPGALDFRLTPYSPAIGAGDGVDLGALPYTLSATDGILYVIAADAVDADVDDYTGNGSSWTNGTSLNEALRFAATPANGVTEIRVAKGMYMPKYKAGNGIADRDRAFVIPAGVKVYGGFAGTESTLDERDWVKNPTFLSGDIAADDKDCYHVVVMALKANEEATLDGFTITGGRANVNNAITVNDVTVRQNFGAGVYATGVVTLENNTIHGNTTSNGLGGGVYASGSVAVTNNTIYGNTASNSFGGGVYADVEATVTNNTIYGNIASGSDGFGGGVYAAGRVAVTNNTIYGNTAGASTAAGSGVCIEGSASLTNNILWNNTRENLSTFSFTGSITYNLIGDEPLPGGRYTYEYNLLAEDAPDGPGFVSLTPGALDFRLREGSPAIDAGSNAAYEGKGYPATDAAGDERIQNGTINIGAYETVVPADVPNPGTYHTLTLDIAPGIDLYGLTAGTHQIASTDHLFLQFLPGDATLGADDVMLVIDGVDTPFHTNAPGSYYSYILNPISGDHTVLIALRQYTVTLPETEGITYTPGAGEHRIAYGDPFTFTVTGDFDPAQLHVFVNGLEILPDALRATTLSYTIAHVTGPTTITFEGNTTSNAVLTPAVRVAVESGKLKVESEKAIDIAVYTITGQSVAQVRALQGTQSIALPAGVYIVRAGQTSYKVVVD